MGERDARAAAERHAPVGIEACARNDMNGDGGDGMMIIVMSHRKECADGTLDRWRFLIIPIDAQNELAQSLEIRCEEEFADAAAAVDIAQCDGFMRVDLDKRIHLETFAQILGCFAERKRRIGRKGACAALCTSGVFSTDLTGWDADFIVIHAIACRYI